MPLIKRIDYVIEQRENSELLISQIDTCLKTREKVRQVCSYGSFVCQIFLSIHDILIRIYPPDVSG